MGQKNNAGGRQIAARTFSTEDYMNKDEVSEGLAITHEQVSDSYMGGAIEQKDENKNLKKGFSSENMQ